MSNFKQKPMLGQPINWAHPLAKGLVGCWALNEGSGNRVFDLSGNSLHGDFRQTPTWISEGLRFTGAENDTDAIEIGDHSILDFVNKMTMLCIVKIHSAGDGYFIFKGEDYWNDASYAFILDSGNFKAILSSNGSAATIVDSGIAYPTDSKQYMTGYTYDGSTTRFYRNGIEIADSTSFTGNLYQGTGRFSIGARYDNSDGYYKWCSDVAIETVYVFNTVKTLAEIQTLYMHPYAMFEQPRARYVSVVAAAAATLRRLHDNYIRNLITR